jgi:flagellar basal-body rod protein FlgC
MDATSTLAISSSALHAQRLRMDIIAANLANAQSTRTADGTGPYKRREAVLEAMPGGDGFAAMLGDAEGTAVRLARVVEDPAPPRIVFDPGHPDADGAGFVAYPNVNPLTEMVDLMAATRAYEANVAAVNATKRVLQAALDIGRA